MVLKGLGKKKMPVITGPAGTAQPPPPPPVEADGEIAPTEHVPADASVVKASRRGALSAEAATKSRLPGAPTGEPGMSGMSALVQKAYADALGIEPSQLGDALRDPAVLDKMRELGFEPGASLDDPKTKEALRQIQEAAGLMETGQLDMETLVAIIQAMQNKRNGASAQPQPRVGGSSGMDGAGSNVPRREGAAGSPSRPAGTQPSGPSEPGTSPSANKPLNANQKEAYDAAIKEGLSPTAAKALVANMTGEALHKPNDHHWDVSHMSQGIVQWDPNRAERIKREFGKYPKDMSVAEQTKAAIWEMKNHYPKTFSALQGSDPQQMMSALVRDYERPADPQGQINKRMGIFNSLNVA